MRGFQEIHGHAKGKRTPEYRAWHDMKQRCTNPKHHEWKNYGARGIGVCLQWQSFSNFLADMGERPSPLHSLDRKENDGDYCKSNCRWATKLEQDRNRRTCRMVEWNGLTKTLVEWAEEIGMSKRTLTRRLDKGMSIGDAMVSKVRRGRRAR